MKRLISGVLLLTAAWAQTGPTQQNWPHYGGNQDSWRHSALTQIDRSNVKKLAPA